MIITMIDKEKIVGFRQRWGITTSDEEEFLKFRNRLLNKISTLERALRARDNLAILDYTPSAEFLHAYANISGLLIYESHEKFRHSFAKALNHSTLSNLLSELQIILWSLLEIRDRKNAVWLAELIISLIRLSPGIENQVLITTDDILIYPAGAKLLDENIIDETLQWLEGYPEVGKHFHESLKIYAAKEVGKYRNLLDNLRFSLEQMLRLVLRNQKSLENQKTEALQWLASHNIHAHVTNMYNDIIGRFAAYQNDAVKHNERYSPVEVEFMIYLTGTFLRLLIQLHRESASSKKEG